LLGSEGGDLLRFQILEYLSSAILRAVVYHDQFMGNPGLSEGLIDVAEGTRQRFFLIPGRNDHGK